MNTSGGISSSPDLAHLQHLGARRLGLLAVGVVVLAVLAILSFTFGTRVVALRDVLGGLFGDEAAGDVIGRAAVIKRVPRTVLAMVAGAALAVSGATMQAVTRNPLAEPGILGVSSGASLAVVIGIAYLRVSGPYEFMGLAVLGAAVTSVFVYVVGSMGRGGATPLKLALSGAATAAALTSLVSAILLPRVDLLSTFRFWQVGGVGGATWSRLGVSAPFLVIGALVCMANARAMNSLALGDDLAAGLGANVLRTRLFALGGAVILCGVATAMTGPIAFAGLIVPHVCRLIVGTDHRWLLPCSAIGGACLLVGADVVGRVVARPEELEVGIVTAVIGAPMLIWLVRRTRVREL